MPLACVLSAQRSSPLELGDAFWPTVRMTSEVAYRLPRLCPENIMPPRRNIIAAKEEHSAAKVDRWHARVGATSAVHMAQAGGSFVCDRRSRRHVVRGTRGGNT